MGLSIRDWPVLFYIMLFVVPVTIAVVSVYEWLDWAFGKTGRDVPEAVERVCIVVFDAVSTPVPEAADAREEDST